jgi:pSer/pThr/pTyr-binding forkhead associated (FHA) protein
MKFLRRMSGGIASRDDRDTRGVQPKDVLQRVIAAMEAARKEGLDGRTYVPNRYAVELNIGDEDERDSLLALLDEEEMCLLLHRHMAENDLAPRGPLDVTVAFAPHGADMREPVRVTARFEKGPVLPPGALVTLASEPTPSVSQRPAASERPAGAAMARPSTPAADSLRDAEFSRPTLVLVAPDGLEQAIPLVKPEVRIGRSGSAHNDIVLADDGKTSKVHVRIERERDGRFTLYDLASTNGVVVNDAPVRGNRVLSDRDEIVIGDTLFVFRCPAPETEIAEEPSLVAAAASNGFHTPEPPAEATVLVYQAAAPLAAPPPHEQAVPATAAPLSSQPPPPFMDVLEDRAAPAEEQSNGFDPSDSADGPDRLDVPDQPAVLEEADVTAGEAAALSPVPGATDAERSPDIFPASALEPAGGVARLTGADGAVYILQDESLIGRAAGCDFIISDAAVSSRHAWISATEVGTYYIEDLGSANGTRINGKTIVPGQRFLLANGDVLMFGQTEMTIEISNQEIISQNGV